MSKQYTGTYLWGFVGFALCAVLVLLMLRNMQIRWTRTWAEKGGRARPVDAAPVTVRAAAKKVRAGSV
jgi:MFS transporter, NNP family, nitrate/nitrite transporter